MKYIVILGDGMADAATPLLGNRTPLEVARKPNMDRLASQGIAGLVHTIPQGMDPGSDTANLSVMGYDPGVYYTGRSPLEAVSMGIALEKEDVALRCNLLTLSDAACLEDAVMLDHSGGEISTGEARELIEAVAPALCPEGMLLYPGVSYRHCLVMQNTVTGTVCTPPHDIIGKAVGPYLPKGLHGDALTDMIRRSPALLKEHPVNQRRIAAGKNPANACWFWGEGTAPSLPLFRDKYHLTGGMISAVDLLKGIGICAGLRAPDVPGATGGLETNYIGKAQAALGLLEEGCDFVYVHIEAPDECGHQGDAKGKVKAIENIDQQVLGTLLPALDSRGEDYAVLLLPDHPTPLALRTHTAEPVPFALWRKGRTHGNGAAYYSEAAARKTGLVIQEGHRLMDRFLGFSAQS